MNQHPFVVVWTKLYGKCNWNSLPPETWRFHICPRVWIPGADWRLLVCHVIANQPSGKTFYSPESAYHLRHCVDHASIPENARSFALHLHVHDVCSVRCECCQRIDCRAVSNETQVRLMNLIPNYSLIKNISQRAMAICISMMVGRVGSSTGSMVIGFFIDKHCTSTFAMSVALLFTSAAIAFTIPNISKRQKWNYFSKWNRKEIVNLILCLGDSKRYYDSLYWLLN